MARKRLLVLWVSAVFGAGNLVVGGASGSIGLARPDCVLGPLTAADCVVVAYGDPTATQIAAYDANGRLRWRKQSPGASFSGELKSCGGLLYAPTFMHGVYVFGVRDGSLKAHLMAGEPLPAALVACTRRRVCITAVRSGVSIVVAFDTTNFQQVWVREFPGRLMRDLQGRADVINVVVAKGSMEMPHDGKPIMLRAKDGRELSVCAAPSGEPPTQWGSLSAPARARLLRIFGTRYLRPDSILDLGRLLAVAHREGEPAMLYVIRADTGRIVWQRKAPGLCGIARVGRTLVALFAVPGPWDPHSAKRLDGFDVRTGRLAWSVGLRATAPRRANRIGGTQGQVMYFGDEGAAQGHRGPRLLVQTAR